MAKFDPFLSLDCAGVEGGGHNPRKGRDQLLPSGNLGIQLLEKRAAASKPPSSSTNANGSASDTENAVATSENGAVNRGFTNASNPGNFYAVCSPPNSAQSNGHVMVTVDT